jgi:hypothetical protein
MKHMVSLVFILASLYSSVLGASQNEENSAPIAFEAYKNCIKAKINSGVDISPNNFNDFCQTEWNEVSDLLGSNAQKLKQSVRKWLTNLEKEKKNI